MDAKKLTNQKNCTMKSKEITEMEIEEMKKEGQEIQRSYVNGIESSCALWAMRSISRIQDQKQRSGKLSIKERY